MDEIYEISRKHQKISYNIAPLTDRFSYYPKNYTSSNKSIQKEKEKNLINEK